MSKILTSKGKSKKINPLKIFKKIFDETRLSTSRLFNKIRVSDSTFKTMILRKSERIAKRFENSFIGRNFNIFRIDDAQ